MRSRLTVAVILALSALSTVAQAQNPAYLKEFPSVDQVLKAETTSDPKLTALLQMTAFGELADLVKILAGPRQYSELSQDEGRLMAAYNAAHIRLAAESDKTWPGPQGNWKRFSAGANDHYYSPTDPRFGSDTHLFQKLLPPDIRTRLAAELDREGLVHEAFLKQQAEEDARAKAQAQASADPASLLSPNNVAALNQILMTSDSAPARRCLELGHTAMECTTKGFIGVLGSLGANLDQSHMKPGLSMTGIYKSPAGPVLTFTSESVQVNGCGTLVGERHAYVIAPRGAQIVLQVASRPQPFALVMNPDGKISGPGTITMDGQVVVGHRNVYVAATTDGTPAHYKDVEILGPKTERCEIAAFLPAGSTPTVASATQSTLAFMTGQSPNNASASGGAVAPPPGLRFGGTYAGPGGLKIDFEIDEAILDCGEAHVRRSYIVRNTNAQIVVTVQNAGVDVPLSMQPDGSLHGTGTLNVAGRIMAGMTTAGPAFVPKTARCAISSLTRQ